MVQPGSARTLRGLQDHFVPHIARQRLPREGWHSLILTRDLRNATGISLTEGWLFAQRLLIGSFITNEPPLHLWVDPRFERHITNEQGHYDCRLCATLHRNFTHEPQGMIPVGKQDGPLIYICHEIGTDSRTREIFLLDRAIMSLPCDLTWETPIEGLVLLPPPTKALRGPRYYQPQAHTVAIRGRGRSGILDKTYPVKSWTFSIERCG